MTTLSLTASPTTLIEAEQTVLTLNFNFDEAPPEEGLLVTLSSDMINSLGEFDVFATQFSGAQIVSVSDDTDGFTLRLTEQTASISLPVFTDNEEEGSETITFTVEPSEEFTLDSDASSVAITLEDTADSTPTPAPVTSFYDEAVDGDISGDRNAPTMLELEEGVNSLTATSVAGDIEYVTLTVPSGLQLDSVDVASYASDTDDIAFAAVQTGTIFTEPPTQTDVENLLGYSHFGAIDVGTDILDDLANGQGAIGFDSPLPSGDYTFWLQQTGDTSTYSLDFNVSFAEPTPTPPPTPTEPVVSLTATPEIVSEEDNDGNPTITFGFDIEGDFPEEGLVVSIGGDFLKLFDPEQRITNDNIRFIMEPEGAFSPVAERPDIGGYDLLFNVPNSTIEFPIFDDIIEEIDEEFTFRIVEGVGYSIAEDGGEAVATLTDGVTPGVGPTVGMSVDKTELAEGDEFTVTFNVEGEIPSEGIPVFVDGNAASLSEFNIFGENGIDPEEDIQGLAGFPASDNDAGGFFVTITEPVASITLSVFDDGSGEGVEELPFVLVNGEQYEVDSNAGEFTLTIDDSDDGENPVDPGNPVVSVSALGGTFNESELISPNIVESAGEGVPVLSLAVSVDGEIPEEGLIVNINSNLDDITEFIQGANFIPTVFGPAEVLGAIYNSDGTATGLQMRLDGPNAVMNFIGVGFEAEGSQSVSFFVEEGVGYEAGRGESIVNVYDSLDQVPELTNPPEVGIEFVSDRDTLIEGGSPGTLNFTVDGEIPPEGLVVYVSSGILGKLGEFNLFDAVVSGGGFPSPDGNGGGFYFKITEPTASIELQAFADDAVEGLESITFRLEEVPGYAIADNANIASFAIADDANSQIQVSLEASPEVLIESENTVSVHTFSLSSPPPAEGLTVSVDAPNLNEFDLDSIEIEGATIAAVGDDGFDLTITEQAATVNLTLAEDNESEGLETAVFTVAEGEGYQVSPELAEANFTIVDTTDQAPPPPLEISEPNDTITEAIATNLSADNNTVSLDSAISFTFGNRLVDQTEDVDMYSFDLEAGDTVVLDIDAELLGSSLDSVLRLFDGSGNQLAQSNDDFAPNELLADSQSDSYLEFTAETEGTYYVGVSSSPNGEFDFENNPYEPFEAGSGTGSSSGEYTLNLLLNQEIPSEPTQDGIENPGSVPVTDDGTSVDETELNDTISNAKSIEVGVNSTVTLSGEIGTTPETRNLIDRSEDVDMYGFELEAGQTLVLDVDAGGSGDAGVEGSLMDSVLRIFDSEGNEVAIVENAAAPDEIFQANGDTYIEFIAPETGTYYAGISNLGNNFYDPNVAGSGSGWTFPGAFEPGPYVLSATLLPGEGGGDQPDIIGTDDAETLEGDGENNSIDALGGDDLVAGLLGDDTVFGGDGDDVLRGDANRRSAGGSDGGDDVISGGAGNDRIGGKGGNDLLSGDAGDDEIFGDDGDDTIMGVTGNDTLTGDDFSGGSGSDLFVFGNGDGTDLITDFDITEDMIGLVEGELTFEELSITNSDMGAMISVIESGETLAVLQDVHADELTEELFMVTPDVSFG